MRVRIGAVACAMCVGLAACSTQGAVNISNPVEVERQGGGGIKFPAPFDGLLQGFSVHLDPTMMLWAKQTHLDLVRIVDRSLLSIKRALASPASTVNVEAGTYGTIPDVGIGGVTDAYSGRVQISISIHTPLGAKELLTRWLPVSLAHELDHAKRVIDGPGYGQTFGEVLVSEGVAEAFAHEVFPDGPKVPWTRPLPDVAGVWRLARQHLNDLDEPVTHDRWLYGKDGLPRFAAYRLGYAIVESYLAKHHGVTAAMVTAVSAQEILKAFSL